MAPLIPIAISLASQFIPSLIGKLMGNDAEKVAESVMGVAKAVTGVDDAEAAARALGDNPELALQFQKASQELELGLYREDTLRLQAVNETIRVEANSQDKYVRRWRPTYGYVTAFTWMIQMLGLIFAIIWAIISNPKEAASVITSLGAAMMPLAAMWGIALSILGVAVAKRSKDKEVAVTGQPNTGYLQNLAGFLKR